MNLLALRIYLMRNDTFEILIRMFELAFDDWDCLRSSVYMMVRHHRCGALRPYFPDRIA
jgi:hypothetical protein